MTGPERKNMRMRYGVHRPLEDAADEIIYAEVRKIKRHSENDILTPWKEKDRRRHEIYVPGGVPDSANRLGIYHRATNPGRPEMNSREGVSRGLQSRMPKSQSPSTNTDMAWPPGANLGQPGDSLHAFIASEGWDRREGDE